MANPMKTPGVYIVEKSAFPNSVVEVETAVPAFIGYTEQAEYNGLSLRNQPKEIASLNEFHEFFGFAPHPMFKMKEGDPGDDQTKHLAHEAVAAADAVLIAAAKLIEGIDKKAATDAACAVKNAAAAAIKSANSPGAEALAKTAAETAVKKAGEARELANTIDDKKVTAKDAALKAAEVATRTANAATSVVRFATDSSFDSVLTPTVDALPTVAEVTFNKVSYSFEQTQGMQLLYYSMRLFFQNGGGKCFVVSVGSYEDEISKDGLIGGIEPLIKEQVPTMVVIPDAVRLDRTGCRDVQQQMLSHCTKMANRVAILDVWEGWRVLDDGVVDNFRDDIGTNGLKNSIAYYPWLETTITGSRDIGLEHIQNKELLAEALKLELMPVGDQATKKAVAAANATLAEIEGVSFDSSQLHGLTLTAREALDTLNDTVRAQSVVYNNIIAELRDKLNLLPPSGAMAGIYTMVDSQRGVWKAPANVSIAMVNRPAVSISHVEQESLNVTSQGKSINAIREFVGEGVLVWGARTLDGNSLDWRYINVRRTMIMLEESIRLAAKAFVFEPNTANTWVTMKSMIGNFLTGIWKRGGLAGSTPEEAFSVQIGLGETMTPKDVHEGILRITVLVSPTHPTEFMEITFQQQMQKS